MSVQSDVEDQNSPDPRPQLEHWSDVTHLVDDRFEASSLSYMD